VTDYRQIIRQRMAVRDGVSISDVPNLPGLRENFRESLVRCIDEQEDVDIEAERLFVVGSFARGTAEKGSSDLDVVVTFRSPGGDNLDPQLDAATTAVVVCVQDRLLDPLSPEQQEWVEGIDVSDTKPRNELLTLERFTVETRENRPDGTPQVYDLDNLHFVGRDEIKSQLASKGGVGQLE
jgi:hypothetical protein